VADDLLESATPKDSLALQKHVYVDYLQRFARKPEDTSALLIAEDETGQLLGCCHVGVALCGIDGRREKELRPSKRPAWPAPWERTDPFAAFFASKEGIPGLERRARLSGLVVSGAARRAGIGRLLVAEAEALARTWGHSSLLLRVEERNDAGLGFYRKLGYSVPAGCAATPGSRLVVDRWGTRWTVSTHIPLQRVL